MLCHVAQFRFTTWQWHACTTAIWTAAKKCEAAKLDHVHKEKTEQRDITCYASEENCGQHALDFLRLLFHLYLLKKRLGGWGGPFMTHLRRINAAILQMHQKISGWSIHSCCIFTRGRFMKLVFYVVKYRLLVLLRQSI